ncbi:hypothetical protein GYMLUDRAFT_160698 [Collybiopsis luxurians FD-317 M1]|nr:hypothetical protein GYMLUDRAFT_160698 [Collybiopsis luxurians FD-317 M1]
MEVTDTLTIPGNTCNNLYQCHSLFQIIWSCVSVLIACTWVSVHLNMPAPEDGFWRILGWKIGLMIVIVFVPEILVLWAAQQ